MTEVVREGIGILSMAGLILGCRPWGAGEVVARTWPSISASWRPRKQREALWLHVSRRGGEVGGFL
jgi:hypothetical protein